MDETISFGCDAAAAKEMARLYTADQPADISNETDDLKKMVLELTKNNVKPYWSRDQSAVGRESVAKDADLVGGAV